MFDFGQSHVNVGLQAWHANKAAEQAYEWSKEAATTAYNRSVDAYKNRYLWASEDMEQAGLNPILAASQGFQVGSGVQAPMAQSFQATGITPSWVPSTSAKDRAQAEEASQNAKLKAQQAKESIARTAESRSKANLMQTEEKLAWQSVINAEKQFEVLNQEVDFLKQNTRLSEKERERVGLVIKTLQTQLKRLGKISKAYEGPAGAWIGYLNSIFGTINAGAGITGAAAIRR